MKTIALVSKLVLVSMLAAAFSGCSPGGNAEGYGRIGDVPRITDPVVGASSRSGLRSGRRSGSAGARLADWNGLDWSAKSGPLCRAGSMLRVLLSEGGRNDQAVCYVDAIASRGLVENVADGQRKSYRIITGGAAVINSQTIFTVEQQGDKLVHLRVHQSTDRMGGFSETSYVDYRIGERVSVTSSSFGHSVNGTFHQRTLVDGKVDAEGRWTEKKITHASNFTNKTGFGGDQTLLYEQTPTSGTLSGYFHESSFSGSTSGRLYAGFDVGGADSLSTFSLGDGAMRFFFGSGAFTPVSAGWVGATRERLSSASSSPYFVAVDTQDLPDFGTVPLDPTQLAEEEFPQDPNLYWKDFDFNPEGGDDFAAALRACDERYTFPGSGDSISWADCSVADFTP